MLNCTVSDPTQLGVPEGASGAVLGALEGHYVFMCWAPSFLRSARARVTRIPESKRGRLACAHAGLAAMAAMDWSAECSWGDPREGQILLWSAEAR